MPSYRQDLLAQLLPVSRALRRIEDAAAARHELSMWQYAVLAVVDAMPGVNQAKTAEIMDYSRNRIIADLDLLEAQGLLVREPGPDRRSNTLRITGAGRRTMRAVQQDIHRGEDELLAGLGPADRADIDRVAAMLARTVRRPAG